MIAENNQGGETVWPGVEWPGTFLGKAVIIRKLFYLHIRMVHQMSGWNRGRASSLSLITRAGFMARLLKVNQAPRHLPHHGSSPSSKARKAAGDLVHTAGCRRKGVRRRGTCLPFRKCLKLLTPFASLSTGQHEVTWPHLPAKGTGKQKLYSGAQLKLRHYITSS